VYSFFEQSGETIAINHFIEFFSINPLIFTCKTIKEILEINQIQEPSEINRFDVIVCKVFIDSVLVQIGWCCLQFNVSIKSCFAEHAVLDWETVHGKEAVVLGQSHEYWEGEQSGSSFLPLKSLVEDFACFSVSDGCSVGSDAETTSEVTLVHHLASGALPPGTG